MSTNIIEIFCIIDAFCKEIEKKWRDKVYQKTPQNGEIELDESYFGARRVRGIRGRGAKGKIPVFGMLKRGDKVYTQIVKNCSVAQTYACYQGKSGYDSGHIFRWV